MSDKNNAIDFDAYTSREHQAWKRHRNLMLHVEKDEAGYRRCLGLAMLLDATNCELRTHVQSASGTMVFVPDSAVSWASIVDVPVGYFNTGTRTRAVHWATHRKTGTRFGLPCLQRGGEYAGGTRRAWDFMTFPHPCTRPAGDALDTDLEPQLFRVFNALEWAMTTTAFSVRDAWAHARPALHAAIGYHGKPADKLMAFGDAYYAEIPVPEQWMPKPYLAFSASQFRNAKAKATVYDAVTRPGGGKEPTYPTGLQRAFVDALGDGLAYRAQFDGKVVDAFVTEYRDVPVVTVVLSGHQGEHEVVRFFRPTALLRKRVGSEFCTGDIVGEERLDAAPPEDWYSTPWAARWGTTAADLVRPNRLDQVMRLWFDRCAVRLVDGFVHLPSQMASQAALGMADDAHLYWEVSQSLDYYNDDCDAMVFPTLQLRKWDDLSGVLPGNVGYDLHPADPRYETHAEQVRRVKSEAHKRKRNRKRAASRKRRELKSTPATPAEQEELPGINLSPAEQEKIRVAAITREALPSYMRRDSISTNGVSRARLPDTQD